jgi:transcriptional regulator with XRE-family HTH domain
MHTPTAAVIRLRPDAFAQWADDEGLASEAAQADRIGVDRATLSRIRRGVIAPGEQFIAAALTATGMPFEDLFEVAS